MGFRFTNIGERNMTITTLTVGRADLVSRLRTICAVVPKRSPKAILLNCRLAMSGNEVFAAGTDLDHAVEVSLDGHDASGPDCVTLVGAHDLLAKVRGWKGKLVTLAYDAVGDILTLTCDGASARIAGAAGLLNEYPSMFGVKGEVKACAELDGPRLRQLVNAVEHCVDDQATRYALGSLQLEFSDRLDSCATDGRRLATTHVPADVCGPHAGIGAMVSSALWLGKHAKTVSAACGDGPVMLEVYENHIRIMWGGGQATCRMTEGRFPKWRDIIPSGVVLAECNRDHALKAVKAIVSARTDDRVGAAITITFDGAFKLELNGSTSEFPCWECEASDDGLTIDVTFLRDALESMPKGSIVRFMRTDGRNWPDAPITIVSGDNLQLIMPLERAKVAKAKKVA